MDEEKDMEEQVQDNATINNNNVIINIFLNNFIRTSFLQSLYNKISNKEIKFIKN